MIEKADWEPGQPDPAGWDGQPGDAVVEALRTYPLDEVPAALQANVMSRVRAAARDKVLAVHFRLTWMDFALSLFFAAMLGVVVLVGAMLPPPLAAYLRLQVRYWFQMLTLQPALPLALAAVSLACAGAALLLALRVAWVRRVWTINR